MTVYVLSKGYDYEGLNKPSGVFTTREAAIAEMKRLELDPDDPEPQNWHQETSDENSDWRSDYGTSGYWSITPLEVKE